MAAPNKPSSSRWGFLQQAVASVESRLDNILAEGQDERDAQSQANAPAPAAAAAKLEAVSRTSSSGSRTNDRLQERLARAVTARNAAQKADALGGSSPGISRTASPVQKSEPGSARPSLDVPERVADKLPEAQDSGDEKTVLENGDVPAIAVLQSPSDENRKEETEQSNGVSAKVETEAPRPSTDSTRSYRLSMDSNKLQSSPRASMDAPTTTDSSTIKATDNYEALYKQLQSDFETSELQRQEEVHDYIERIDALQSKLQYLAKEAAENARKASGAAPAGSMDKKLADKEEQVALLMEEGQKLSKKELNQLTTIKKLRAKVQEDNKNLAEAQMKRQKAEKDAAMALDRLKQAQGSEKVVNEKQRIIVQLQKDVESLKGERSSRDSTIAGLKVKLEEAAAQEKQAEAKLANEALVAERRKVSDLEDTISNLKIEKTLVGDRAQSQIKQMQEKIDKDAERARIAELEMKTEQQMLESKLEVMRARAEEVSSGATGDAQAKLLRQIETLQTQYAVASENWQGIEASLVARATNLEKERDEATKREADIRKKAREVTLKAKRHEAELEETRSQLPTFQQELAGHKAQLDNLQKRAEEAESALVTARKEFDQEKASWNTTILQRLEEERQRWQEESNQSSRAESPVPSRRGLTSEYLGMQNLQIRRASARSINSDVPTVDRLLARRPSAQVLRTSGSGTPTRQDSMPSVVTEGEREPQDTPSIHTDHDDFFEQTQSPTSPHQTLNDMVSASTAAAGPSVQLVERMSLAVRRLESEKVATKEDLSRLSAQRDEARAEIVTLMREVAAKRAVDAQVAELEKEMEGLKGRYDSALEMLGEKSELVDELRSDIVDLKAMYRELVERTVK